MSESPTVGAEVVSESDVETPDTDTISKKTRTKIYYTGLVVAFLLLVTAGLAPIWLEEDLAEKIQASTFVINSGVALLLAGLGVAYRPTRTS